jgi:hypothetical protein
MRPTSARWWPPTIPTSWHGGGQRLRVRRPGRRGGAVLPLVHRRLQRGVGERHQPVLPHWATTTSTTAGASPTTRLVHPCPGPGPPRCDRPGTSATTTSSKFCCTCSSSTATRPSRPAGLPPRPRPPGCATAWPPPVAVERGRVPPRRVLVLERPRQQHHPPVAVRGVGADLVLSGHDHTMSASSGTTTPTAPVDVRGRRPRRPVALRFHHPGRREPGALQRRLQRSSSMPPPPRSAPSAPWAAPPSTPSPSRHRPGRTSSGP